MRAAAVLVAALAALMVACDSEPVAPSPSPTAATAEVTASASPSPTATVLPSASATAAATATPQRTETVSPPATGPSTEAPAPTAPQTPAATSAPPPTPQLGLRPPMESPTPTPTTISPYPPSDPGTGPPSTPRPPRSDNYGIRCVAGGDVIPAGSTANFAGYYITAPPGMDIEVGGISTGEVSGVIILKDAGSASGLRIGEAGIERIIDSEADAARINEAFDQLIATLVSVPPPAGDCFS